MKKSDAGTLLGSDIFKGLTPEDLRDIVKTFRFEERLCKKHEDIFTPENYSRSLAVILKGSADVYKETEKGRLFMSILPKGAVFGMAVLFYEGNGFINTVCAREDCRVLFITKEQLEKLFALYPVCAANYITVLSEKIHYLNSKIAFLTSASPAGRLLSWLISESEKQKKDEFCLPMSYSELADALSLGRTSLYRSFDELEQQGRLIKNGKTIKLIK